MGGEFGDENGYMCMSGWVPSLFTWNYHNIVIGYNQYKIKSFFFLKKNRSKCMKIIRSKDMLGKKKKKERVRKNF